MLSLAVFGCSETATPLPEGAAFEVGVNDPETALPGTWQSVSDGDAVRVTIGNQGSLMLVGAVRTDQVASGEKVTVTARLEDAETGLQRAKVKFRRALIDGGDGYGYLLDAYLVLGKPGGNNDWQGREAVLTISIESDDGTLFEDSCRVLPLLEEN